MRTAIMADRNQTTDDMGLGFIAAQEKPALRDNGFVCPAIARGALTHLPKIGLP